MSRGSLDTLMRTYRRQLVVTRVARISLIVFLTAAVLFSARMEPWVMPVVVAAACVMIFGLAISSARSARDVQTGSVLLTTGRLDDAEVWFRQAMSRFSLSFQARLVAGQQFAALLFRRDAYDDVVLVCRALLGHPLGRLRSVWFNVRLLLVDSLLMLDRRDEAYEAMRPVYDVPLSLLDRMKLLPVQLRYELAANHTASAVRELGEKIKVAELLDAPGAALVHALLAEACDRQAMGRQRDFLTARAWLYHDLTDLADRYELIAPLTARTRPAEQGQDPPEPPPARDPS